MVSTAALIVAALAAAAPASRLALPAILGDHAVVQSGGSVPVWGWAKPGARVTVVLAGQERKVAAGKDGRWRAVFNPVTAGPVGDLTASDGKATVVSRDLLAGEVWVCSGQSNMQWSVGSSRDSATEIQAARFPAIRLFQQEQRLSDTPVADTRGRWQVCTPESVKDFSAVGYFFGRELHRTLNVPVGLINASWGGTNVETWMDRDTLRAAPGGKDTLDRWAAMKKKDGAMISGDWRLEARDFELVEVGNSATPLDPVPDGRRWLEAWAGSGATITFTSTGRDLAVVRVAMEPSGWAHASRRIGEDGKPVDASKFTAIRMKVRGHGRWTIRLSAGDVQPWEGYSSAPFPVKKTWTTVEIPFAPLKQPDWAWQRPLNPAALTRLDLLAQSATGPNEIPGGLFNAEIHPLLPHAIRGAIWYQGESNAWAGQRYEKLFTAMVKGWRTAWGLPDLAFHWVQLANFMQVSEVAQDSDWAELRESQVKSLALPHTGMAVIIDAGEAEDIHPKDKQTVGKRLALSALAKTYGMELEDSGPVFDRMTVNGATVTLRFTHTTGGMSACRGGPVTGFSIAGADRKFVKATATIRGDTVEVTAAGVANPVAVRYAWANNPVCNLINGQGLPAGPFRTDDWPLITAGR